MAYCGSLLFEKCKELETDFHFNTSGYMLTQDVDGKVTGVIAKNADGEYEKYSASRGVVLASGTFAKNQEIVDEIEAAKVVRSNRQLGSVDYSSLASGDGDGQRMVCWARGEIEPWNQFTGICMSGFQATPGLSINTLGKRWHNEDTNLWIQACELESQPGKLSWEVFDGNWLEILPYASQGHLAFDCVATTPWTVPPKGYATTGDGQPTDGVTRWEEYLDHDLRNGVGNPDGVKMGTYMQHYFATTYAANTLDELATMMFEEDTEAIANFLAEVEEYNVLCDAKADTRYGKRHQLLHKIETPPFYASSSVLPGNYWVGEEGVVVDGNTLAVLRENSGKPIGNLWAAGVLVGGRHANQYLTPLSGMNHGFCLTLGKVAGQNAAKGIQ